MGLLLNEIATLYRVYIAGEESPLMELPIQYADYAVWQREWLQGEVLEAELAYWREQLHGELPGLALPTDRPRPAVQSYRGARELFHLDAAAAEQLRQLSRDQDCTLFMTLLAAFQTLLYRYSGQEEILVGTDIAGRNRAEVEPLIGFFVNQLVLRARLSAGMSFVTALQVMRETTLGAYAHQELPFEKLVEELQPERDAGRSPLFQVKLVLQNAPVAESFSLPGIQMSRVGGETGAAKFDLTFALSETGESLSGLLEYNTDLFEAETVVRLLGHFENLLRGIGADAEQRLSELPLLSATELSQMLVAWNDTAASYAYEHSVTELFEGNSN
jgi:non-ribosomal peptide synthetase component F